MNSRRNWKLLALPLKVGERDALRAALLRAGLPAGDIEEPGHLFFRFETSDDVPVGFGGLELHGYDALLRSLVVLPPLRRSGIGATMVGMLESEARVHGCRTLWLLTTAADRLFLGLGYQRRARDEAPDAIRRTPQFTSLCPDTAVLMAKPIA